MAAAAQCRLAAADKRRAAARRATAPQANTRARTRTRAHTPPPAQYGNGTLRLTTRQAYQLHGVLKTDLKTVFSTVIKNMGARCFEFRYPNYEPRFV